jgi:hypothetical protein
MAHFMKSPARLLLGASIALFAATGRADVKVVTDHNPNDAASWSFRFKNVARPAKADAATGAQLTLVSGERDANGGDLARLVDGRMPTDADQPQENFFFAAGTKGGRIQLDLGKTIEVGELRTYSWHPGGRAPQVYTVYASDGSAAGFDAKPAGSPTDAGWKQLARVDTSKVEEQGGQHAASITDTAGALGKFRYLLFDVSATDPADRFSNTFLGEIDVIDLAAAKSADEPETTQEGRHSFDFGDGRYHATIDTTKAPDLTAWAEKNLVPVVSEWYPKLVAMLPSEGFEPTTNITLRFRDDMGGTPASAGGGFINCNIEWFRKELDREAVGSVVHEMVHLVQNYRRMRRDEGAAGERMPGWLTEGIPDYIRWFLYEPETRGAEITRRNISNARYNASYRVSGNFLDWAVRTQDKDLVAKLNAAARKGAYSESVWKDATGKTSEELGAEWKKFHEDRIAQLIETQRETGVNILTDAEKEAGWKLLFNGETFNGWHNYRKKGVQAGWQIEDGTIACVDPHHAGDLSTDGEFAAFELELEYNISEGGNSGIMFHVQPIEGAAWATGPEIQLEDNAKAADPQRCGWLYGLYKPDIDPKTGKPLDATKPAGEWNHVRIVISPEKCEHVINGVKYFDYVMESDDFKARVAKSKFGRMPNFAKAGKGAIVLQGDHGKVAFRNVKIRSLDK